MRFTDVAYKNKNDYELCEAINILSVKIGSLDIEFPVHVYGTVIARDSLDKKCVYLFQRDREESQTISHKEKLMVGYLTSSCFHGDTCLHFLFWVRMVLEDLRFPRHGSTIKMSDNCIMILSQYTFRMKCVFVSCACFVHQKGIL